MKGFFHHSRLLQYRTPQGAVPCGTAVRLSAKIGEEEKNASISVRFRASGTETLVAMTKEQDSAYCEWTAPDSPQLVEYSFLLTYPDGHEEYYGGSSGEGRYFDADPGYFRIVVYDAAYTTPEWFRKSICYQIFPDRFCRSSWEDFHDRIDYESRLGRHPKAHERWSEPAFYKPARGEKNYSPDDFFGGDLNGIISKLDYLASFGVTCIYLNPIFASSSNHRYNTADYMSIDPLLGSEDDFRRLCEEARKRGIRIMLDGVFSHTGSDSIYFNREGHYGKKTGAYRDPSSPYREWYLFRKDGSYECWWNFETLPNVWEMTPSYIDFIAGSNGVIRKWANAGATSWRLDVADELPDEFIRILRKSIKGNDPDGVILGEVWEDPTTKTGPEGRRGYVNGDELDSVMNYGFTNAVADFLSGKTDAYTLSHALQTQREQYPAPFYAAALNLISSHDIPRAATVYAGAPDRSELTREQQAVYKPSKEKLAYGFKCMRLAAALQAAVPGVPCIYYGDEAGLTGMADPFNRETYPWGREDMHLLNDLRAIFHTRSESSAMQSGKCRMGAVNADVFCVIRYDEHETVIACVNRSSAVQTVSLSEDSFPEGPDGGDRLSVSGTYTSVQNEQIEIGDAVPLTVPPVSAVILTRKS